jgi:hypothetical protein
MSLAALSGEKTWRSWRRSLGHNRDQRPVPQAHNGRDIDVVEKLAGLLGSQHRGLAALHDMLGPTHGMGRVGGENLADYQPVEQHADCRQVLLDARRRARLRELLDIHELLGYHRPRQPAQRSHNCAAAATVAEDRHRHPAGRIKP